MTFQPYIRAHDLSPRRIILLVEDEPFVREATCGILESAGFEVLSASDLPQALDIYQRYQLQEHPEKDCPRKIDLVMTDMMLPSGTGQQLGRDLRRHSPKLAVLVTSGYPNPDFETESSESHMYFLAKPYSKRTLCEKIESILAPASHPATQAS